MIKLIKNKKGISLVEALIVISIVAGVTMAVISMIGTGGKKAGVNTGADISNIRISVPVINESTVGNYSISNIGNTGIPTNITFN